ncbi:hypothetical protein NDU88_002815 [Pleurodeles waltl]|uniref:Uncharacterized protein n=1 Tax=Pleurodeles waltl TaxID=8319 RepID=A0AAV7SDS4_PLEWA|nr:hypothetical protein NDU88_002815 [Pleurodeles waltl]
MDLPSGTHMRFDVRHPDEAEGAIHGDECRHISRTVMQTDLMIVADPRTTGKPSRKVSQHTAERSQYLNYTWLGNPSYFKYEDHRSHASMITAPSSLFSAFAAVRSILKT